MAVAYLHKKTYIARVLSLEFSDDSMRDRYLVFKIGSSANPASRLAQMSRDKYSEYGGESFLLEAVFDMNIENALHRKFNGRRLNYGMSRELFYFTPEEMDEIIRDYGFRVIGWDIDKNHRFNKTN